MHIAYLYPSLRTLQSAVAALVLAGSATVFSQEPAVEAPAKPLDIAARLGPMMQELERMRLEHHVAGLGIAVVYNDEVILCDGLGEANIEQHTPAGCDSVFAIGSASKAFTATVIAMLIDEGKMDWDEHVRTYLPKFHVKDAAADEAITIRDLLCHRTGLSRMGLLWAGGALSRDEILDAVVNAEPSHEFRKDFNYSNINFIAAGRAAGAAADSDWESLVRERIFAPLHMETATVSVTDAKKNPKLATGYMWDDIDEKQVIDPMRSIDAGGPAGSINASPRDMANWLRFQLAHGEFDGDRLVSAAQMDETHTPQIGVMGAYSYALGWMVGEFQSKMIIEHGGNIDGFSAQVAFIPELNLGYVLLMNASFTPLQQAANGVVLGTLLKNDEANANEDGDAEDLTPYLGKYVANFGPFKDARFTVEEKNGALTVDVPGQMAYELQPPNEDGKRPFTMTDTIAVSFDRNEAGVVTMLKMYQAGLTFECPREGMEVAGDVALDEVRDLLGTYHFELQDADVEVLMQNGRLAIDVPGQMVFEMHPPNDDDQWVFRAKDDIAVQFNRGEDGDVESLTMFQAGMAMEMPRVGSPDPAMTATLDDVMELHQQAFGGANLGSIKTLHMSGTINFVNQAVSGTMNTNVKGLTHYSNVIDLGRSGKIMSIVAGDMGWSATTLDPTEELKGKYLRSTQRMHPLLIAADWRDYSDSISLEGIKSYDGRPHYVVNVTLSDDFSSTVYLDVETGLVTGEDLVIATRGIGQLPMKTRYSNYRDVGGIMLPTHVEISNDFHGKTVVDYDTVEVNIDIPAGTFAEPPKQLQ